MNYVDYKLIIYTESLYNGTTFILNVPNYPMGRFLINHGERKGYTLSHTPF